MPQQQIIINQVGPSSNGCGTTGFVFALLSAFFCWIPILDWILFAFGLLFSFIGLFKRPRGLAIAGFIISVIDLVVLILLAAVFTAAFAALLA